MSELLKITSPVEVKNRISGSPKSQSTDAIFDLTDPAPVKKEMGKSKEIVEGDPRKDLLHNLNKEIYLPLLNQTKVQSDSMRKLILYSKLFEVSRGIISEEYLTDLFWLPKELLSELLKKEEGATIFKGEFFDALRVLSKGESGEKLNEAILAILKHFDCYVNQKNSLDTILAQAHSLLDMLRDKDRLVLEGQLIKVLALMEAEGDNYGETIKFLKNEMVAALRTIAGNYPSTDEVYDKMLLIIHYIVRYDKANPKLLEESFIQFAEEVKPLFPNLSQDDIVDMRKALLEDGNRSREEAESLALELGKEKDMASFFAKALHEKSPARISSEAQSLLLHMVQSESPMLPLLHFMIPLRFRGENTYGEFLVDKECKGRKKVGEKATNIFFTIQSDLYGTFEVDLLAKDRMIELDIKCPKELIDPVKGTGSKFKDTIEELGYRLANYQVGEYKESKSILKRFPELMDRRAGIDVRI